MEEISFWKITVESFKAQVSVLKKYKDSHGVDFKLTLFPGVRSLQLDFLDGTYVIKFEGKDSRWAWDEIIKFYSQLDEDVTINTNMLRK